MNYDWPRWRQDNAELIALAANSLSDYEEPREKLFTKKQEIQLQNQEQKIRDLENRVQELTNSIKMQKEKIIDAFLNFFPEKDLLQELIKTHLEFSKAKKQNLPATRKLRKEFNQLYEELEEKWDEEPMKRVEIVLGDCEKLIDWELELEEKLNNKNLLSGEPAKISLVEGGNLTSENNQVTFYNDLWGELLSGKKLLGENKLVLEQIQNAQILHKEPFGIPSSSKKN
ncbi:hypothetical protein [endosymbiont GvMRE of Glomus versiforme]|uniref:hypothetical protein n=1 Tax=endosymbiont GvMRE of Glomus versiforme TaxID=2039283 RepID=UPI000ED209D0|nr:hypothetical protein [endosymbiont GvMRE of Glomus versiforme]RHZ36200.1 hypothetical protein GvMRE_Ic2g57 [endosymbiont GvMRE of Glomus versiforme]